MKRDFDLIRALLLQVEAAPAGRFLQAGDIRSEADGPTITEHVGLMVEQGLIKAAVISIPESCFDIEGLTWKGHDFLAAARNDTVWKQVMGQIKEKGLALTISVVTGLLSKEALRTAGLG